MLEPEEVSHNEVPEPTVFDPFAKAIILQSDETEENEYSDENADVFAPTSHRQLSSKGPSFNKQEIIGTGYIRNSIEDDLVRDEVIFGSLMPTTPRGLVVSERSSSRN